MKKILSLFLASLMLLSLFTGITSFASTVNSETTGDGGTLWYKYDFENGITDTINSITPTNNKPVAITDSSGLKIGEFAATSTAKFVAIMDTPAVNSSTDRYFVAEFDFKRGTADSNAYIGMRNTANTSTKNFLSFDKINQGNVDDWMHVVLVIDRQLNSSSKYGVYAYSFSDGKYTVLDNPNYKGGLTTNETKDVRIEVPIAHKMYFDNLEFKTYDTLYSGINMSATSQEVVDTLDRFSALGFVSSIPDEYSFLGDAQKASVAQKLLNQNFTSDAAVFEAMETAIVDEVVIKDYYNWDFEDETLNDSVSGEQFMMEFPSDKTENRVVVDNDPTGADNKVAKINLGINNNDRLNEIVLDSKYSAGDFKYLTYTFRVYPVGDAEGRENTVAFSILGSDPTHANRAQLLATTFDVGEWHNVKILVDTEKMTGHAYELNNGEWTLVRENPLLTLGFNRIRIDRSAQTSTFYYDDFKITGYNSIVSELNEASVSGTANVLEIYDELGIIDLPAAYASLDDAGRAAFAASVKSATYTSAQQIQEAITIYFSTDDLVLLSSANDANGKLDSLKLYVKKDGVNLATSEIFVATYVNDELKGLTQCPQTAAITTGSVINLSGLLLDVDSSTAAKVIIVNNTADLTPAVKTLNLK